MPAARKDYILEQGAKWEIVLTFSQLGSLLNLTGAGFRMQVRESVDSASTIFSLTIGTGIAVNTVTSKVTVTLTGSQTAGVTDASMCYDLEYLPGSQEGNTIRVLQGSFILSKEVTR